MIEVESLSHKYSRDWAVRDISFLAKQCGVIGLLGANGAGKSTCMNVLTGILKPTCGEVLIGGDSILTHPEIAKSRIGYLPQQTPVYKELTVVEYLRFCARLRDLRPHQMSTALERVLDLCGLNDFADRLIGSLSGGYRQRCGLAQAILHQPNLVILDEPTNGLDPVQIKAIRTLVKLAARDSVVLISSHILSEIEVICDRVLMLTKGELTFDGTAQEFRMLGSDSQYYVEFLHAFPETTAFKSGVLRSLKSVESDKFILEVQDDTQLKSFLEEVQSEGLVLRELKPTQSLFERAFERLSCSTGEEVPPGSVEVR